MSNRPESVTAFSELAGEIANGAFKLDSSLAGVFAADARYSSDLRGKVRDGESISEPLHCSDSNSAMIIVAVF